MAAALQDALEHAFGFMEMRQMLRAIKNPGERLKLLLADDAHPSMMEAALEAPNAMSGIDDPDAPADHDERD